MAKSRIDIEYSDREVKAKLAKLRTGLTPASQRGLIRKAADVWHGRMTRRTPRRWTGDTAKAWKVFHLPGGEVELTNISKTMVMLEKGTKAHGPKKAKRLFIPLTKKAAQAGARGVIRANRQWSLNHTFAPKSAKRGKPPFIMFHDFVWAKRVKGIKAMWIVRTARIEARASYRTMMTLHIRNILKS